MSGILSSCCPFLTNAAKEGVAGSPPYSMDMRLRIHNWANSLSGSKEVPRTVAASSKEKSGLPEFSRESSVDSFQKSSMSLHSESDDGECTVIFAPPAEFSHEDAAQAISIAPESMTETSDWETDKGHEEEEVSLLEKRQAVDEEGDGVRLERKEAKMTLPLKPQYCELPVPYKVPIKITTMPNTKGDPDLHQFEPVVIMPPEPVPKLLQEISNKPSSEDPSRTTEALPPNSPKKSSTFPNIKALPEDASEASVSTELLDAISSLSASQPRSGKARRSRMTSTRAPTPWNESDEREEAGQDERANEGEQLETAPSSSGSSLDFESALATADSSFHTLPTVTSSAERAGGSGGGKTAAEAEGQEREVWEKVDGSAQANDADERDEMKQGEDRGIALLEVKEGETIVEAAEEKPKGVDSNKTDPLGSEENIKQEFGIDLEIVKMATPGKVKEAIQSWETAEVTAQVNVVAPPHPWKEAIATTPGDVKQKAQAWETAELAASQEEESQGAAEVWEAAQQAGPGELNETAQTWETAELADEMNETAQTWETADLAEPAETENLAQTWETAEQADPAETQDPLQTWETAEQADTEELEDPPQTWETAELATPWEIGDPPADATTPAASGDHASGASPAPEDDVSLRYFNGGFRPDDHFMARHAGLQTAAAAEEAARLSVPSGLSDSAVTKPAEIAARPDRSAASDSTLALTGRSSSPGPPATDGSGVALEAKHSDMALPIQ